MADTARLRRVVTSRGRGSGRGSWGRGGPPASQVASAGARTGAGVAKLYCCRRCRCGCCRCSPRCRRCAPGLE
eukprot:360311-Chlamydomonas_euryale.AAC.3